MPSMVLFIEAWQRGFNPLPPPWFIAVAEPACGIELDVPAESTTDGIARHFVCDVPVGPHPGDKHRQVIDNESGEVLMWPV